MNKSASSNERIMLDLLDRADALLNIASPECAATTRADIRMWKDRYLGLLSARIEASSSDETSARKATYRDIYPVDIDDGDTRGTWGDNYDY